MQERGGQPLIERLNEYLRGKQLLLMLDNFEQVVDAAPLVGRLLATARGLKVLVTSREPLHIAGEHEYAVPPLLLPDPRHLPPLDRLVEYAAVQLFIARAQAVKVNFVVTHENAPAIAAICQRLDGLPLAIELAAARIKLLPPQALLARLDQTLKLLTGGARDTPTRQQTMRATIDWSYHLLDEGEQALFARLGVFVGGCTLDAAEAVGNARRDLPMDALNGLAALVGKSLLQQIEGPSGEPRFTMLETIREYALEQLRASGEQQAARQQHAAYFLAFAETTSANEQRAEAWLPLLAEEDNLRAALQQALNSEDAETALRLIGAQYPFWLQHGNLTEANRHIEAALALPQTEQTPMLMTNVAHTQQGAGWAATLRGDHARALVWFERAAALYQAIDDQEDYAATLRGYSFVAMARQELVLAERYLEQSLALCQERQDVDGLNWSGFDLAFLALARRDFVQAEALFEDVLAQPDDRNEVRVFRARFALAHVMLERGAVARAKELYHEGWRRWQRIRLRQFVLEGLEGTAAVAVAEGMPRQAALLCGAAEALRESSGTARLYVYQATYERTVAALHAQLDTETFAAAWADGRSLSLEQAIAEALRVPVAVQPEMPDQAPQPDSTMPDLADTLTPRERQVLALIAQGASNRAIADTLVIAERTAEIHVSNILGKLGVTSRTQAAAYAVAHGLAALPDA